MVKYGETLYSKSRRGVLETPITECQTETNKAQLLATAYCLRPARLAPSINYISHASCHVLRLGHGLERTALIHN